VTLVTSDQRLIMFICCASALVVAQKVRHTMSGIQVTLRLRTESNEFVVIDLCGASKF